MDSRGNNMAPTSENGSSNGDSGDRNYSLEINNATLIDELLRNRVDTSLYNPDMGAIRQDSYKRSRQAMAAINPSLAKQVLPEKKRTNKEEHAAVIIQSQVRGYLARKQYVDLLYAQYEREEEERQDKARLQVEEGELLVENYRLSTEMNENSCLRRNLRRSLEYSVITIQRAWRRYRYHKAQHGESEYYKPPTISIEQQEPSFSIRTNPFEKIHRPVFSDEDEHDDKSDDVFNDSLEQISNDPDQHFGNQVRMNLTADEECELFDDGISELQSLSSPSDFPSPTTDWESIESCLNSEGEPQDTEQSQLSDNILTNLSLKAHDLQICFVDESLLTDEEEQDEDGYSIKEYVIENKQDVSDDEKRDSGCVAGDEEDKESFSIKTLCPDELISTNISNDESKHVLLELTKHEEHLEKQQTMKGWTVEKLQALTLDEIRALKRNFERLIQAQNEMLVRELMTRDALHLKQDSMLMEVEDSTKLAQAKYLEMTKPVKR